MSHSLQTAVKFVAVVSQSLRKSTKLDFPVVTKRNSRVNLKTLFLREDIGVLPCCQQRNASCVSFFDVCFPVHSSGYCQGVFLSSTCLSHSGHSLTKSVTKKPVSSYTSQTTENTVVT